MVKALLVGPLKKDLFSGLPYIKWVKDSTGVKIKKLCYQIQKLLYFTTQERHQTYLRTTDIFCSFFQELQRALREISDGCRRLMRI